MKKQVVKVTEEKKKGTELLSVTFDRGTYKQLSNFTTPTYEIIADHVKQRVSCTPREGVKVTFHVPMCRVLYYVEL